MNNIRKIYLSILNSYPVIFLSESKIFGVLILLISFADINAGILGLLGILSANLAAYFLGLNRDYIIKGYFGFTGLLLGIGFGMSYGMHGTVILTIIIISLFSPLITSLIDGFLKKYYLPFLSLPFLFVFWFALIIAKTIPFPEALSKNIFIINQLFSAGGHDILKVYYFFNEITLPFSLNLYLKSLSSILFQNNIFAGMLLSVGLLISSRVSFILSLLGFYSAVIFYSFLGLNVYEGNFEYIGFNFILIAIAAGGYFMIPTMKSYIISLALIPISVFVTLCALYIFSTSKLPVYSLPFVLIVIFYLYTVKLRYYKFKGFTETPVQTGSPEKNLYNYINNNYRFSGYTTVPIRLPFYGEWFISQGHNGELTHKDKWRHAWDFVINDHDRKTYKNNGYSLEDYYCFNKTVISPGDGFIQEVIDGIEDNKVGNVNTEHNWGNTIIIKHNDFIYSKLSHLKKNSIKVKKGDWVKSGQIIANCGSSGRSPEPHLHFQLQNGPDVVYPTIDYPISDFVVNEDGKLLYKSYHKPEKGQYVKNVDISELLNNAFNFKPGQKIVFRTEKYGRMTEYEWYVYTDIFNSSYIYCSRTGSSAYFYKDKRVFYFYKYNGNKKALLYYFFLGFYKIPMGVNNNLKVRDELPLYINSNNILLFLQDIFVPLFIFLGTDYELFMMKTDGSLDPSSLQFSSKVSNRIFSKNLSNISFSGKLNKTGIQQFEITDKRKRITAVCIEQ